MFITFAVAAALTAAEKPALAKQYHDFDQSITISIADESAGSMIINYATLTGGEWRYQPEAGSTIAPGDQPTYVVGTSGSAALGGQMVLTPASGGEITIEFSWDGTGEPECNATPSGVSGLSIDTQMINTQSRAPTCQFMITNSDI